MQQYYCYKFRFIDIHIYIFIFIFPTYIICNCLDLILTHEDSSIIKSTILSDIITDHFSNMCK